MEKLKKLPSQFLKFKAFIGPRIVRLFYVAIFAGFFLFFIESSFVIILQGFLMTLGIAPKGSLILPKWYPESLGASLLILAAFGFFRAAGYFCKSYIEGVICQSFNRLQRERVISYSLDYAADVSTHEAISIFTDGISLAGGALQNISALLLTTTAATFFLILGLRLAPLEMSLGLSVLGVLGFFFRTFDRRIKSAGKGLVGEWDAVSATLLDGIKHNFFLRVYGLIGAEKQKAFKSLENYQAHHQRYQWSVSTKMAVPPFLGLLIIAVVSYVGLKYFGTPGAVLLSFFYIFMRLLQSAQEMVTGLGNLRFNLPQVQRVYAWHQKLEAKIRRLPPESFLDDSELKKFRKTISLEGISIECRRLSFRYGKDEPFVFRDLELKIKRGDCLVITGESGVGKSTLLSVILGIHAPVGGLVEVNQHDIRTVRRELFGQLAYIGPEPYLIRGTVIDNLFYGHPDPSSITQERLWSTLKIARADVFVNALSEKENTFLNEVAKLSTGQKQRLAIARALLREPKLLVMDECTSNLDFESEAEIVRALADIMPRITAIVVTHRLVFNKLATQKIALGPTSSNIVSTVF